MKAAVIGLGQAGYEFGTDQKRPQPASHFHCYNSLSEIETIALCDSSPERLEQIASQLQQDTHRYRFFNNYEEALKTIQPDVVSICTPTPTHEEIAVKCAESGVKSIFLEKPIAQTVESADRIIQACQLHGVKLTVNYTRRWNPLCKNVFDRIIIDTMDVTTADGLHPKEMIGMHPGPLLRTGTHMIDLFNWFADSQAIEVRNFGMAQLNYLQFEEIQTEGTITRSNDWNISGYIQYGDQSSAVLLANYKPYVLFELDVFCGDNRYRLLDNCMSIRVDRKQPSERYRGLNELAVDPAVWIQEEDSTEKPSSDLFEAVREVCDLKKAPSCSGADALEALRVALMLHYSYSIGQAVDNVPSDYEVKTY